MLRTARIGLYLSFAAIVTHAQKLPVDSVSRTRWYRPAYIPVQFAGNIGFLSAGVGFAWLHDRIDLALVYGYVPASIAKRPVQLVTLKGSFRLFDIHVKDFRLLPYAGLAPTVETGRNSFIKLPSRYPGGYYHSNAFHLSLFAGVKFLTPVGFRRISGVEFFIETGSQDIFLYYLVTEQATEWHQVLSMALGVNLRLRK